MSRPVILDLFCGAGGVALGLQQAGFDVVGVDLHPQPRYPGAFLQRDVTRLDPVFIRGFDAAWASPPCQGYTLLRHAPGAKGTAPQLIASTRDLLNDAGVPWVIENVAGARAHMPGAVRLCGTMFGLGAQGCELHRHRLFLASFPLKAPSSCKHSGRPVIGVYGGHARKRGAKHGGRGTRDVWEGGHRAAAAEAMGMPHATLAEMSEAVPPAYSRWIGEQMMRRVRPARTAA